jgi:hypothetical protein
MCLFRALEEEKFKIFHPAVRWRDAPLQTKNLPKVSEEPSYCLPILFLLLGLCYRRIFQTIIIVLKHFSFFTSRRQGQHASLIPWKRQQRGPWQLSAIEHE